MKITVERGSGLERTLTVEVAGDVVQAKINDVAADIARRVNVPGGYRKIQAKIARVKQLYRGDIASHVASDLVEETLRQALEEKSIKTVGMPRIVDLGVARQGQPFVYKVVVETYPTIDNPKFSGFIVPTKGTEVEADEVDARLEQLRKQHSQLRAFEGDTLVEGLRVTLAIAPEIDDAEKAGRLSVSSRTVTLDKNEISEFFFDALVGQKSDGELRLEARVGDLPLYNPADMEDETHPFVVTLTKVEEQLVPELDDDFANEARGLKSLLALRGELREELQKEKEHERDSTIRAALTQQLLLANPIDLPYRTILEMYKERMKPYEESMERYRESLGDELVNNLLAQQRHEQMGSATNETALYFLMEAVASKEGLEPTDEEVEAHLADEAKEQGVETAFLKAKMGEEKLGNLKFQLRADKVFETIRRLGIERPYEEFVAIIERRRRKKSMHRRHRAIVKQQVARKFRTRRAS